jgi:hypothetical protein
VTVVGGADPDTGAEVTGDPGLSGVVGFCWALPVDAGGGSLLEVAVPWFEDFAGAAGCLTGRFFGAGLFLRAGFLRFLRATGFEATCAVGADPAWAREGYGSAAAVEARAPPAASPAAAPSSAAATAAAHADARRRLEIVWRSIVDIETRNLSCRA